ncbi:MAG: hypothetical protein JHC26_08535 [Thermofilum sp.]|uniref:hypothetical protein n=1 Tax=Thermofilum sp. TaxID=1961369 RepID=UPI00258351B6|nr:hypothetical protein [Thermofilum sp.]MCI4409123.1 hypothetical protein [Thermofilum sp.]
MSEKARNMVLLVVGLSDNKLYGLTKLQKISFLINQKVYNWVKFKPSPTGPFSDEIMKAVDVLEREGKLKVELDSTDSYELTKTGEDEYIKLVKALKSEDWEKFKKAREIVEMFSKVPPGYLVAFIYKYYPGYFEKGSFNDTFEKWVSYFNL